MQSNATAQEALKPQETYYKAILKSALRHYFQKHSLLRYPDRICLLYRESTKTLHPYILRKWSRRTEPPDPQQLVTTAVNTPDNAGTDAFQTLVYLAQLNAHLADIRPSQFNKSWTSHRFFRLLPHADYNVAKTRNLRRLANILWLLSCSIPAAPYHVKVHKHTLSQVQSKPYNRCAVPGCQNKPLQYKIQDRILWSAFCSKHHNVIAEDHAVLTKQLKQILLANCYICGWYGTATLSTANNAFPTPVPLCPNCYAASLGLGLYNIQQIQKPKRKRKGGRKPKPEKPRNPLTDPIPTFPQKSKRNVPSAPPPPHPTQEPPL